MHVEAFRAVEGAVRDLGLSELPLQALDVGGRDVNGNARGLLPEASWTVLDVLDGPAVDIVADVTSWTPGRTWDLVLSTEALEHVRGWPEAVETMVEAVRPGGWLILTAATDPRLPHSAIDGGPLRPDEWYENVPPHALQTVLIQAGLDPAVEWAMIPGHGGDVYAWGRKPG